MPRAREISEKKRTIHRIAGGLSSGPNLSDWEVVDRFVREVLIVKKMVVFWRPRRADQVPLLVLTTEDALRNASKTNGFCVTDAKMDTNQLKAPLSSIVGVTQEGTRSCWAVWIAGTENTETTQTALDAFFRAVPCSRPGCSCELDSQWSKDGSFKITRSCAVDASGKYTIPLQAIGLDKNWSSINACKCSVAS